jgi:ribosome-associated heat shock protein Hsp15
MKEPLTTVRVDRWLSAARFYKTRTQAAKACEGGKVKVNGKSAKPHKFIHIGDEMTIHVHGRYRNLTVTGLADRGLPPAKARELYEEIVTQTLSEEAQELMDMVRAMHKKERREKPKYKGRPTKKVRRQMDRWKE